MWPKRKKNSREEVLRAYRQRRAQAGDGLLDAEPIVGSATGDVREAKGRVRSGRGRSRRARGRSGTRTQGRIGGSIGIAAALTQGWRSVPSRPFAAGLALLLGLTMAHMGLSGRYRVQGAEAQVTGNARLSTGEVIGASEIEGRNIFTLDPDSIARSMEAHSDLKRVRVASALPSLVTIEVIESEVMLLLDQAGTRVGVDDQGRIVALPQDGANRPVLRDEEGKLAPNGVAIAPDLLDAATAYSSRFPEIAYREAFGFVGQTEEGWPVRLGKDDSQADAQFARLDALLLKLREEDKEVELIDLRYNSRPYYRLQGETP
jgi:cell division septal protein FtsQ